MNDTIPTAEQALEALNNGVDAAIAWDTRAALDYIKVVRAYIEQTRQPALAVALPEKDDMHPTNRYLFRVLVAHHGIELGKDDIATALAKIPHKIAAPAQQHQAGGGAKEVEVTHGYCPICDKPIEFHHRAKRIAATTPPTVEAGAGQGETFQQRVEPWLLECFGAEIAGDAVERNHRFLEEALELVQACGCTRSEAHQLVDYVFGREVGEKVQEAGGVMVTLAALCRAQGIDMHESGEIELARIWTKVEKIRAKQAAKPKHSPLPEAPHQPEQGEDS